MVVGYASQFLSRITPHPFLRAYVLASVAVLNASDGIVSPLNEASDQVPLLFLNSRVVVFISLVSGDAQRIVENLAKCKA